MKGHVILCASRGENYRNIVSLRGAFEGCGCAEGVQAFGKIREEIGR